MAPTKTPSSGDAAPVAERPDTDDAVSHGVVQAVQAMQGITATLSSLTAQLERISQRIEGAAAPQLPPGGPVLAPPVVAARVGTFEDDVYSEVIPTTNPPVATPIAVPAPPVANVRLRVAISEPRPPAAMYAPGTSDFRWWATQAALERGIAFWTPLLPAGTTWSTTNPMRVALVAGQSLNANYSRANGLRFYQQRVRNVDIFSCESPDVVLHELGHGILDALKPGLFNAASAEVDAFHESFGDMSAMLCALQLPSLRLKVLAETFGRLNVNSRLSRLAEQLGWGIRQLAPTAVDRDCLRNAANRFAYQDPNTLPPSAPAQRLSSESHSFSRVFTGAFLDALARMLLRAGPPTDANLLAVSRDLGRLLADGIRIAPIRTAYYSQVAAAMIQADRARNNGRYRAALTSAFIGRGILSLPSALALEAAPVPELVAAPAADAPGARALGMAGGLGGGIAGEGAGTGEPTLLRWAGSPPDEGYRAGFGATPELPLRTVSVGPLEVQVHAPEEEADAPQAVAGARPRSLAATAAPMPSPEDAARIYLENLMQNGRVDMGAAKGLIGDVLGGEEDDVHKTHVLDGARLLRRHFNCACCRRA